ncbi:MAG: glycosyltransferase [Desulfobulbaceae bacterium]|uniref:Glycosyltransferase n=1 Tax=Candidatus Desulfatifera sulfidica TaxID=2841691 RepID=A0A8J6T9I0_9BACT|nr:glycosyltransferase [Candidatus Desulfatifera sulfidica]
MHILIVHNSIIPAHKYGGTERVIWYLGKELVKQGHCVSYLVNAKSQCPFAKVIPFNETILISSQIPSDVDVVHFNGIEPDVNIKKPYVITQHGNLKENTHFDLNTIFVSKNHATRHNSMAFVHNGIDWDDYGKVDFKTPRKHFHFLAKAAWRIKNVAGAIKTITNTKQEKLVVLGGYRLNFKMGFRFTLSPRISFKGMVGGEDKYKWMRNSKGLLFPVKWHEPFGLALIESLYFGSPVFGTLYGSLPELITKDIGFLSNKRSELSEALENASHFEPQLCHQAAVDLYNAKIMANKYLSFYDLVLNGSPVNQEAPKVFPPDNPLVKD